MRVGTSYFVSRGKAELYYADYEIDPRAAVERKLAAGEIHLGKPPLKPGDRLRVIDHGTRYEIEEARP